MKFTLNDLKIGQVVETRGGLLYVVTGDDTNIYFMSYNNCFVKEIRKMFDINLKNNLLSNDDIVKVYKIISPFCLSMLNRYLILQKEEYLELLWERKKEIKLTDDEKAILRNLPKKYKWITRDKDCTLCLHEDKPCKLGEVWCSNCFMLFSIYENLFQFIKWENEEPCNIEELIKEA